MSKSNSPMKSEAIKWAQKYLSSHGYPNEKSQDLIVDTPWSYVVRIQSETDSNYLKGTPRCLALEPHIIGFFRDHFNAPVARVIAQNNALNCFLMADSGKSLREVFKRGFDVDLACGAAEKFKAVQENVSTNVKPFLDLDVPDWRLAKFPTLFEQVIEKKNLLIRSGLSEGEIRQFGRMIPKISQLCDELSIYGVAETFVQPDFNDNNMLVDEISKKLTIIDLGEISISHPFFSLLNYLHKMKQIYGLKESGSDYTSIKDSCFFNQNGILSRDDLSRSVFLSELLFPIYGVMAHIRLIEACEKGRSQDKPNV